MNRPIRVLLILSASAAVAGFAVACGTQRVNVPASQTQNHAGAIIFSQRCAGCHTLSYAGTRGSAGNARTRGITDGPNFNVRCERPITRVLYAIANGGFSGAIMPQNIVTGQQAREVAQFVATYAGRSAPKIVGQQSCESTPIGTLPSPTATTIAASVTTATGPSQKTATTPQSALAPAAGTKKSGTSGKVTQKGKTSGKSGGGAKKKNKKK